MELDSYSTTTAEHHKGRRCQVELKYKVFRGKYGRPYFDALESTRWEQTVRPASVLRDDKPTGYFSRVGCNANEMNFTPWRPRHCHHHQELGVDPRQA